MPNWGVAIIAAALALLQALILFVLKDMKHRMEEFVSKDLCSERHRAADRRLNVLEHHAEITGVRNMTPVHIKRPNLED